VRRIAPADRISSFFPCWDRTKARLFATSSAPSVCSLLFHPLVHTPYIQPDDANSLRLYVAGSAPADSLHRPSQIPSFADRSPSGHLSNLPYRALLLQQRRALVLGSVHRLGRGLSRDAGQLVGALNPPARRGEEEAFGLYEMRRENPETS
jgi:hypothetical protein